MDMASVRDKVVIVLGVGKGNIGAGLARRFAREGAKVVIAGRREDVLRPLAQEIQGDFQLCDITQREQIDALIAFTMQRHGRVDVGINATGWGLLRPFEETTEEELKRMMDLQFKGPFQFM